MSLGRFHSTALGSGNTGAVTASATVSTQHNWHWAESTGADGSSGLAACSEQIGCPNASICTGAPLASEPTAKFSASAKAAAKAAMRRMLTGNRPTCAVRPSLYDLLMHERRGGFQRLVVSGNEQTAMINRTRLRERATGS